MKECECGCGNHVTKDSNRFICGHSFKGKRHSDETKRLFSNMRKGKNLGKDNPFYGKHHTEESKEKLRKSRIENGANEIASHMKKGLTYEQQYGEERAKEIKKKLSESGKGRIVSEETRRKIGIGNKGNKLSEEHKQKVSEANRSRQWSEESRKKMSESKLGEKNYNYGKHPSEGTRRKMQEAKEGMYIGKDNPMYGKSGPLCPAWNGGTSLEPYGIEFNDNLRSQIRDRDNHICQLCNTPENSRALDVHHIDYDKKNNSEFNLISLCLSCHIKTNYNREIWQEVFSDFDITELV